MKRSRRGDGPDPDGRGVLLLAVLALLSGWLAGPEQVSAIEAGEPVPLTLETLHGDAFRLLPGVGPVLAGRLEQARVRAGGRLDERAADQVSGVGDALLARWRAARAR